MDGGAWWAAVHRVTQSWTRLKRLSIACIVKQREPVMHALKILKRCFVYLKGSMRYHLTFFSGFNQRHYRTAMNLIFTLKLLLTLRVSCQLVKLKIRNSFIFQPRESWHLNIFSKFLLKTAQLHFVLNSFYSYLSPCIWKKAFGLFDILPESFLSQLHQFIWYVFFPTRSRWQFFPSPSIKDLLSSSFH